MSKIPKTDSVTELARFWDTHDVTEFEDELEEVRESVFDREDHTSCEFVSSPRKQRLSAVSRGPRE